MLQNKVAVVTGSTSGIGLGIAEALAADGASIMLNGFGEPDDIAALRKRLEQEYGVRVGYNDADMTVPADVAGLIEQTTTEFSQVDILVNNAGIQFTAPIHEFPVETWDRMMAINLSAPFHAIRAVLPQMLQRDWGRLINIASVHGLVASIDKAPYISSKHGLVGMTKAVALETACSGVTCNAIGPGFVLTPLIQSQIDDRASQPGATPQSAKTELLAEKQPSLEFVTPEQLGRLACFLCSPAADQIRGQCLAVDGGWTAQ